jgi:hypothetical protein
MWLKCFCPRYSFLKNVGAQIPTIYYDSLFSFDLGVNTGVTPIRLPGNQVAFGNNVTVRGSFATSRPPFILNTLDYSLNDNPVGVQQAVTGGFWQGWTYFQPDSGSAYLIAQISGRTFVITPSVDVGSATVVEVTIPGDPNPATVTQAWLWQAERWAIINDGLSIPIFYDSGPQTSRRSLINSVLQGTVAGGGFTVPPIGGTVEITLAAPYTGLVGSVILINSIVTGNIVLTGNFVVTKVGGEVQTNFVTLTNLTAEPGETVDAGNALVVQPANLGIINQITNTDQITNDFNNPPTVSFIYTIVLSASVPSYVTTSSKVQIINSVGTFSTWKVNQILGARNVIVVELDITVPVGQTVSYVLPLAGDAVILVGNTQPNITVGTLLNSFVAPQIGNTINVPVPDSTVQAELVLPYSGLDGEVVFIGQTQWMVTEPSSQANSNDTITVENLNVTGSPTIASGSTLFNLAELPVGRMGCYGLGRNWLSLPNGLSFVGGDINGGSSGSPIYNLRDAVLKWTENTAQFPVPNNNGIITAMRFTALINTSLGQGPLQVVTPGGIFTCNAPVNSATWAETTNPILTEALIGYGGLGQSSTIVVNGDLIYRAVDGIRSLIQGQRLFDSWGNVPISFEVSKILAGDNLAGLPFASAIQFDNRLLMTCDPIQYSQGVYHPGLVALNFDPISGLNVKLNSVYDGLWTGLNVLQLATGIFNGVQRAFAMSYDPAQNGLALYEILPSGSGSYLDNNSIPIVWSFESPPLFRNIDNATYPTEKNKTSFYQFIKLVDGEVYLSDIQPGTTVTVKAEYRPDYSQCWYPWHTFTVCNDADSTVPIYGSRQGLGAVTTTAENSSTGMSTNLGRWFQVRFTITGHCIFMGARFAAAAQPEPLMSTPEA